MGLGDFASFLIADQQMLENEICSSAWRYRFSESRDLWRERQTFVAGHLAYLIWRIYCRKLPLSQGLRSFVILRKSHKQSGAIV